MQISLSLNQADTYAGLLNIGWDFLFTLRGKLGIPQGKPFSFADGLDILNGYGYGEIATSDILVESVDEEGDVVIPLFGGEQKSFDKRLLLVALMVMHDKFWMLTFAHGAADIERNLKVAYRYRKMFLSRLDDVNGEV